MTKERCGDSHSEEGGEGEEAVNKLDTLEAVKFKIRLKETAENKHDLLHHDDNVVDFDGLQSAEVTGKKQKCL